MFALARLDGWIPGVLIAVLFVLAHWLAFRVKEHRERTRRRRLPGCTLPRESGAAWPSHDPIVPE